MKKKSIIFLLLMPLSMVAQTYQIFLSKENINPSAIQIEEYTDSPSIGAPIEEFDDICQLSFENVWTTGQYGSPAFSDVKLKMENGSYYDYGTITSNSNLRTDFDGGYVLAQSYGGSWKTGGLIDDTQSGIASYPYFIGLTGSSADSTNIYTINFNAGISVSEIEYNDYVSSVRYTTNYDIVLTNCSGSEVFRKSYTQKQSSNTSVSNILIVD
jgi:hypothetical protein